MMKYFNKIIVLGLLCMIPLVGCDTDELIELNINPTAANELDWRFLFTTGQARLSEQLYVNGRVHLNLPSGLIQQTATMQVGGERGSGDKYYRMIDAFDAFQITIPPDGLKALAEVIRQTGPDGKNPSWTNLHNMAQVSYIYTMQIMTDLYGNVPYSEANKGIEGIFFPKYDSQESIYKDMLAKLETAANAIGSGPDAVGAADVIFQGDFAKWKKFTNSMMLRLAMRVSNVDPALAQQYVQKAISGGVMQSNDDIALLPCSSGPSQ
ncbi:MAG: SusD/RagB family nutrient-binding outer membrane lipoprotein [Saprospiraceae bacterium]|nr:SusD/RagB family nutrient-binding outer membrane lipoprotein [Saprospiraceae bacterium]